MEIQLKVTAKDGRVLTDWVDVVDPLAHDTEALRKIDALLKEADKISLSGIWKCTGISFQSGNGAGPVCHYRMRSDD